MKPMVCLRRLVFFVVTAGALVTGLPDAASAQAPGPGDVVLWTAGASPDDVHGEWVREADETAAGDVVLRHLNQGKPRVEQALPSPTSYFEMRFTAEGSTAYHLWVRMKAQNDSTRNDSIFLQFSDSVSATGESTLRIGSTSAAEVTLQNGQTGALQGWGWSDNGFGTLGAPIYFAADGAHVLRVQSREDGATIDQIVLSPVVFSASAPGATSLGYQGPAARVGSRARRVGRNVGDSSRVSRGRTDFRNVADHFRRNRRRVASASQPGSGRHHD